MMTELDLLNGFAGKVIGDCIDLSVRAIQKADENRKSENQTMETRIYQVTVDVLNQFPYNQYKNKEKVYDAAECMLKQLKKGSSTYSESVRAGLNMISSEVTGDICEIFLKLLCYEICKEENRDLAAGHIIHQQRQMNQSVQEGFDQNRQDHEVTHRKLDDLIKRQNERETDDAKVSAKSPITDRADEYARRWDRNVFLNNYNEEDENAGVNIKLSEIYIEKCLPHYTWKTNKQIKNTLRDLLTKYIIDNREKKMLLILGRPGIGKSTLITWIMANLAVKKENVLVYQFASDFGNINWQGSNLLKEILKTSGIKYGELEGKTLILDGFDEIHLNVDRERALIRINEELEETNILKKFSLIITCRENYINLSNLKNIEYILLQVWNEDQIRAFCEVFERVNAGKRSETVDYARTDVKIHKLLEKKEIFGIPLILYLILALRVEIENNSSIVNIYDQIFSLEKGSIYDRCYDKEHRINSPEIKGQIHRISQRIAFWMFENNHGKASIPQETFQEICDLVMKESGVKNEDIQRDVLIGNYFAPIKHCEGIWTDDLEFVHRSVYEYFVTVYFHESVRKLKSIEELAGKLGELLKEERLSEQILQFIKFKFDRVKGCDLSDITKKVFHLMLRDGMTYYTGEKYKNIIVREKNIFANMLELVLLWNDRLGRPDPRIKVYLESGFFGALNLKGADLSEMFLFGASLYGANLREADLSKAKLFRPVLCGACLTKANLRKAEFFEANLSQADLKGANLRGANLSRINLSGANLSGANLEETDFSEADFGYADLEEADFRYANLEKADFNRANLSETIFDEKQVDTLCKKYDLTGSRVYISETGKIMSYKEYCLKKQGI